jgi:hypothetical protein
MKVDYSEQAIDLRIRRLAQLRNLCLSLAKAGAAAREKRRAEKENARADQGPGAS